MKRLLSILFVCLLHSSLGGFLTGSATAGERSVYNNVAGTFSWLNGNETFATATESVAEALWESSVQVGSDLTVAGPESCSEIPEMEVPLMSYQPATDNPGCVAGDMIEYKIKLKDGLVFTPTSVIFDAVKVGTDNGYFSWSYVIDGMECGIMAYDDPKLEIRRNSNVNPDAPLTHNETINTISLSGQEFALRFYISNTANNKRMLIGNIKINGIVNTGTGPSLNFNLSVGLTPEGSGTINTQGGTYEEGSSIRLSTSGHTGFVFLGWYEKDELVSKATTFTYTMPSRNASLVARYEFNPTLPPNPEEPITYYELKTEETPSGAGTSSGDGTYAEGTRISVSASAHTGFVFKGWYEAEDLVSQSRSFNYTMPARDVTLVAHYEYDPSVPANPEEPKTQYKLKLELTPQGAGSVSGGGSYTEDQRVSVSTSANTGFVLTGWYENEELVSSSRSFSYTMPARDVTLTARYEYNPGTPSNPNKNHWNPQTGEVIIDDFVPGSLDDAIVTVLNGADRSSVLRIVVIGRMNDSDFSSIRIGLYSNCTTLDISRVKALVTLPANALNRTNLESVILPASITKIEYNAFQDCSKLKALTIYAENPPALGNRVLNGVPESMIVYVPEKSVDLYKEADGWKNYDIQPMPNDVYSIPVGATPDDPSAWNDLNKAHQLTLEGTYENPNGENGKIQYSIEDYNEWQSLTGELKPGDSFKGTVVAKFDPEMPIHYIRLRAVDVSGTILKLNPITYEDVSFHELSGIEDKVYCWGDSIYQTSLSCDLPTDEYVITGYKGNVNAGAAAFNMEGVYPKTIGRKTYNFNILPAALTGEIEFTDESPLRYDGTAKYPKWKFAVEKQNQAKEDVDYRVDWRDNLRPGTATLAVKGIRNFTDSIKKTFVIDKGLLSNRVYRLYLPEGDAFYDGQPHGATFAKNEGVGDIKFYYAVAGSEDMTEEEPVAAGDYDVYVEILEGEFYYGMPLTKFGSFTIYNFDQKDWQTINALNTQLQDAGVGDVWNLEGGISSVSGLKGIEIEGGHVVGIDISDKGLTGAFPTAVFSFPNIKKIDLSNNEFSGNLSTTVSAMALQRPASFATIDTLNVSGNRFNGNLGILCQCLTSLDYLAASDNGFEDVYPAIPESVSFVDIARQKIDRTIDLYLSDVSIDKMLTQFPTIVLYDPATRGYLRELDMMLTNQPISGASKSQGDVWSLMVHVSAEGVSMYETSGNNTYRGTSGDVIYVYDVKGNQPTGTSFTAKMSFDKGDANFLDGVDASDLQATILYAFGLYSDYPFNFTAANTYEDDVINVQDVTCTVNILLSLLAEKPAEIPARVKSIAEKDYDAEICLIDGKVILRSERPVAAMSLKAGGDILWTVDHLGLQQTVSGANLVAYSLPGEEIPAGETVIGEYTGNAEVSYVSLADPLAVSVKAAIVNPGQSEVNILPSEMDGDYEIFDVTGARHSKPVRGLNIIVRDGKAIKYYNIK